MKPINPKLLPFAAALLLAAGTALSQQPAPAPAASPAPAAAAPAAGEKTFSQQDLDQMLAPIALYPDSLLAQILMASTYPLEIVEAARWSKANPKVTGKDLEDAMQKQEWDPSVKALTSVPTVLKQLNENLTLTQKLGDAFLAQQEDVMKTVQTLRTKAKDSGNLKSTPEQIVKTEQQEGKTVTIIESAKTEVVYVPTYNPAVVYGTWWYPYPPYSMYPPGYVYAPGLAFATGVVVGAAIWGNCNWGGNNVNVNVNKYNNFNKTNISNGNFQHNADHRKGVSYKDSGTAQKYNRGGDKAAAQSREQFRGRSESGSGQFGGGAGGRDASGARPSTGQMGGGTGGGGRDAGSRPSTGQAGGASGGGNRASTSQASRGGGGGGGFSGAGGGGASTRAASSRGGASRGGGGGGGGRRR
jgi:hypothetical protein